MPERMKEEYKARGYSIIAFTDHNVLVDHSYLADGDFLRKMCLFLLTFALCCAILWVKGAICTR